MASNAMHARMLIPSQVTSTTAGGFHLVISLWLAPVRTIAQTHLAEAVLLAREQHQRRGEALRLERIVHVHGLIGRHHLVFLTLHNNQNNYRSDALVLAYAMSSLCTSSGVSA